MNHNSKRSNCSISDVVTSHIEKHYVELLENI